jgi:hypothetical protein
MTPIINTIQTYISHIVFGFLIVGVFCGVVGVNAQLNLDRIQRVYQPNPLLIPADRDGAFRLFFPYNNPTGEDYDNVVAEIRIQGSGFAFIPDQTFDYYSEDPSIEVDCSELDDIPKYPVDVTLSSRTSIVYGLQSANNLEEGTGDSVNPLPSGSQGCMQVTLAIDPDVIVGETAIVYMNWYIQGVTDTNQQPPVGLYNLEAVKGENLAEECRADEELFDGICVSICRIGEIRDSLGNCVDQSTLNTENPGVVLPEIPVREAPEFDVVLWLYMIFGTMLGLSLVVLIYSFVVYKRYNVS